MIFPWNHNWMFFSNLVWVFTRRQLSLSPVVCSPWTFLLSWLPSQKTWPTWRARWFSSTEVAKSGRVELAQAKRWLFSNTYTIYYHSGVPPYTGIYQSFRHKGGILRYMLASSPMSKLRLLWDALGWGRNLGWVEYLGGVLGWLALEP